MKIILGLIAAVLGYGVFWETRRRRARCACIAGRDILNETEIYERFYAEAGLNREAVATYWNAVARLLRMTPGQLRPNDRFNVELAPVKGAELSDEIEELGEYLEDERKRLGLQVDLEKVKTLDDVIRGFAAQSAR